MKLKKIYEGLVTERYLNLLQPSEKEQYVDIVWDMLDKSYKKIGGYKGASSPEELIEKSSLWKLVRKNNKIVALAIYKDERGRKSIGVASDGTDEGKNALFDLWLEDLKFSRAWGEVSGAAEAKKLGLGYKPIPNKYAEEILGKDVLSLNPDGIHYTRLIGGIPYEKVIVGKVPGYSNVEDFKYTK